MSKIDELIQELCPDGVEYLRFDKCCEYVRGVTYSKSQEVSDDVSDAWRVLRANNILLGSNTLIYSDIKKVDSAVKVKESQILKPGDILICAGSGSKEHVGKVAYIYEDEGYTFGGFMAAIRSGDELCNRFLFHVLTSNNFKSHLTRQIASTTINNLNAKVMSSFRIPVPPMEVQEEIVRILDSFTELEKELEKELSLRQKQYEYYRDEIFRFEPNNQTELGLMLKELCPNGIEYTPLLNLVKPVGKIKWGNESGELKYIDLSSIKLGTSIIGDTLEITKDTAPSRAQQRVMNNDVLFATTRPEQMRCALVPEYLDGHVCSTGYCVLRSDSKMVIPRWIFYCLGTCSFLKYVSKNITPGNYPSISDKKIKAYSIPVPPLEIQEEAIRILDSLYSLVNDISEGLPAEIEARRKQYEYYRDKLLTFNEKVS